MSSYYSFSIKEKHSLVSLQVSTQSRVIITGFWSLMCFNMVCEKPTKPQKAFEGWPRNTRERLYERLQNVQEDLSAVRPNYLARILSINHKSFFWKNEWHTKSLLLYWSITIASRSPNGRTIAVSSSDLDCIVYGGLFDFCHEKSPLINSNSSHSLKRLDLTCDWTTFTTCRNVDVLAVAAAFTGDFHYIKCETK